MLTDSIDQAFDSIFTDVRQGSNAVISGKTAFDLSEGTGTASPTLDESLLPEVRALPDVADAEGSVDGEAQLIGDDGKAIVYGGAPNLGFSIAQGESPFNPLTLVDGAWPGDGEVVIDRSTADKENFELGQDGRACRPRGRRAGSASRVSSASVRSRRSAAPPSPASTCRTAQELFGKQGRLDEIAVAAKPGVSDDELVERAPGERACDRAGQDGDPAGAATTPPRRTSSSPSCAVSCSRSAASRSSWAAS